MYDNVTDGAKQTLPARTLLGGNYNDQGIQIGLLMVRGKASQTERKACEALGRSGVHRPRLANFGIMEPQIRAPFPPLKTLVHQGNKVQRDIREDFNCAPLQGRSVWDGP